MINICNNLDVRFRDVKGLVTIPAADVEQQALLEKLALVPGRNPRLVPVPHPVPLLRY